MKNLKDAAVGSVGKVQYSGDMDIAIDPDETSMEDLLRPEGVIIHQEVKDNAYDNKNGLFYNYGIGEDMLNRLLSAKDSEIQLLKDEVKYLKEKMDQLLVVVGKKG